jgi:hypothetical protein
VILRKLNPFYFFLLVSISASLYGQDTAHYVKVNTRFITEKDVDNNLTWQKIDTGINRIEIFQPAYKKYILFQDLGNLGTPSQPLLFNSEKEVGFHYTQNPYELFAKNATRAQYINTKTPYSDLFYAQGKKELIFLTIKHAQNISPRWNIGLDFQRITSLGYLQRQYTSHYNYQFFTAYQNKSKRYTLLANATWNRGLTEESGGILSDSLYESLSGSTKVVSPVLTNAQSRYKNRAAYVKQYWNFGSTKYLYNDNDTLYDFENKSHFAYTFHAEDIKYIFENKGNSDSSLLPNQFYDIGSSTYDSSYYGKINNKIEYNWFNSKDNQQIDSIRRFIGTSLLFSKFLVSQIPFTRNYANLIAAFTIERIALKNYTFSYMGYGAYNISGFNSGDFKVDGTLRYRLPSIDFSVSVLTQSYRPDYTFLKFKSNQFIWEHDFDKTNLSKQNISLTTRKWRHNATLSISSFALNNWVYVGTTGTPIQEKGTFLLQTVTLSKTVQAWKFYFEHELMYQYSGSDILRVPTFGGMTRYYFASTLFKKIKFHLGFSVFYNTAYYGNSYNPATRFFTLQNATRIGNYPVIDPFFNGEIKRVAFFVKYEHVNQDWFNSGFYYTPHYPLALRSLRFGVRWRFYD